MSERATAPQLRRGPAWNADTPGKTESRARGAGPCKLSTLWLGTTLGTIPAERETIAYWLLLALDFTERRSFFFSPAEQTGGVDSIRRSTSGGEGEGSRTSDGGGSPEGGAFEHPALLTNHRTHRKERDKIYFDEGGRFLQRNFTSCFEEKEVPSAPSIKALTAAGSQPETGHNLQGWLSSH